MKLRGDNISYICGSCGLLLEEHAMFREKKLYKRNINITSDSPIDIDVQLPNSMLHLTSQTPYRTSSFTGSNDSRGAMRDNQ